MSALELVSIGFIHVAQPLNLALVALGTFLGIIFGVIPGLTGTICLVFLMPVTYAMSPLQALILMGAVYCGSVFGGAISAITLNIPGTPEAICTTFDGHQMAKKGLAGKALGAAVEVSALGGFLSVAALLILGPLVAKWAAVAFSSAEFFSLILMGLFCVVAVSGKSLVKGLIALLLGILISCIGTESMTEVQRFTFGSTYLAAGLEFVPVVIGIFAISEFFVRFEEAQEVRGGYTARSEWVSLKELWRLRTTIGISGILGYLAGVIPGLGATLASFLAYGTARSISKRGSEFGTGALEGVVAPETANNSATGGAMLPLLTLGIPGGTQTAIMLGVLLLHGIRVGPAVFDTQPDLVGATAVSMLVANLAMLIMGFYLARFFAGILKIKWGYVITTILVFCFIGAFSLRALFFDVYTALIFGVIGYFMRKRGYPLAPFILGFILGPLLEEKFITTMMMTGNFLVFVARPVSLSFLIFALAMLVFPLIKNKEVIGSQREPETISKGEFIWLLILISVSIYAFISAFAFNYIEAAKSIWTSAALFPWLCSAGIILISGIRLAHAPRAKNLLKFGALRLSSGMKRVLVGGGWLALYFLGEMFVGHIFSGILVLPFLLHFTGIRSKKLLLSVPLALVFFTTLVFTSVFYIPLPVGVGIFHTTQTFILSKLALLFH